MVPVEALQVDPPFEENLYPVMVTPSDAAVNATLNEVSPPVIPVIVGAAGCNAYRRTTIPEPPSPASAEFTVAVEPTLLMSSKPDPPPPPPVNAEPGFPVASVRVPVAPPPSPPGPPPWPSTPIPPPPPPAK